MEDLLITLASSSVSDKPMILRQCYKSSGQTDESRREKRRAQLLEDYKRKRDILLNEKRGLLNDAFSDNEEWMDWQEPAKSRGRRKKWVNPQCKNQLMLSEWLLDRPHDLDTAWTCVVSPEGQRTLVVAKRGCTRAYHKSGLLLAKFKSILPNGAPGINNRTNRGSGLIILDCIWNQSTKQLFALDVLYWNNQPLLNCDAQFRLYWLKSKLMDVKKSTSDGKEMYDVHLPSHCSLADLPATLAEHQPSQVDGVLFFHNRAPYLSGPTPLVGWLKPFMLPERLGLQVSADYLALRPPTYEGLEQWVATVSHAHTRSRTMKPLQVMELSNSPELEA